MNIIEKENCIIKKLKKASQEGCCVYIYGSGEMGRKIKELLRLNDIQIKGFCVDSKYYRREHLDKCKVFPINSVIEKTERKIIVVTFRHGDSETYNYDNGQTEIVDEDIFSLLEIAATPVIDYMYYIKNADKFEETFKIICDDKSRVVMEAFINQKISGKKKYLKDVWETCQYYDPDIVDFSKINSIVDCGAYNGDTFLSFLENYRKNVGREYKGSAYLLEPDAENYKELEKNFGGAGKNISVLQIGAYKQRASLTFASGNATSSGLDEDGDVVVEMDAIDNFVQGKIDFIKMDIEGAELDALHGAESTIKEYHPLLAICVYHKRQDLLEIPNYIRNLYSGYKLYLRAYSPYSQELVLYAVAE